MKNSRFILSLLWAFLLLLPQGIAEAIGFDFPLPLDNGTSQSYRIDFDGVDFEAKSAIEKHGPDFFQQIHGAEATTFHYQGVGYVAPGKKFSVSLAASGAPAFANVMIRVKEYKIQNGKAVVVPKTGTAKLNEENQTGAALSYSIPSGVDFVSVDCVVGVSFEEKKDDGTLDVYGGESYDTFLVFPLDGVATAGTTAQGATSSGEGEKFQETAGSKASDEDDDDTGMGTVAAVGAGLAFIAIGAYGFSQFTGNTTPSVGNNPAGEATVPEDPPEVIYTDPATGAQSRYVQDPVSGDWVNAETGGILDPNRVQEVYNKRIEDRDWAEQQMTKLKNKDTIFDQGLRDIENTYIKEIEKINQQTKIDQIAIRNTAYGLNEDQLREKLATEQDKEFIKAMEYLEEGAALDSATKNLEIAQVAIDIAVDTLATVTAPAGGGIVADGYAVFKNLGGSIAESNAEGRSFFSGLTDGLFKSAVDVMQSRTESIKSKLLANIGGETAKECLSAALKGENMAKAAEKGLKVGTLKAASDITFNKIGDAYSAKNFNKVKDHSKTILQNYSKTLRPKSVDVLRVMNTQKYLRHDKIIQVSQTFVDSSVKNVGGYLIE